MTRLTADGQRVVEEIARRHDFSAEAAMAVLKGLVFGNGVQAQFDHPELGGLGQWSGGGMVMVGDMFNHRLKARVDALCTELSDQLHSGRIVAMDTRRSSDRWAGSGPWPADLGEPAASGSQNDVRYAYFPSTRRLAVERDGTVTLYDTANHMITGVSQQQSRTGSVMLTSQLGEVDLSSLEVVAAPARAANDSGSSDADEWEIPKPSSRTAAPSVGADIFTAIERLHDLRQKQIISAQEFETKKAELLARL